MLTCVICAAGRLTIFPIPMTLFGPQGRLLGIKDVFTPAIAEVAVALSGACDPQVAKNAQRIYDELAR